MKAPEGICIHNKLAYVTDDDSLNVYNTNGKFLKSVGKKGKKKLEFDSPSGVAVCENKNRIYICDTNRIQCLNLNLTFHSVISDVTRPLDIKLTPEEIMVLTHGDHWIQYYNYANKLIREIIPLGGPGSSPFNFCIDVDQNILVTYWSDHYAVIFTSKGELIQSIGGKGEERGKFYRPTGIAIDSEKRIIVASQNHENCLQMF